MRTRARTITALAAAALLALTACGTSSDTTSDPNPTTAATPATTAAAAQTPDAKTVTQTLANTIDNAKPATVYTATSDPNKLLGRPGGYTSKADWTDNRAKPELDDAVQSGGTVEVYDTAAAAKKRADYIAGILQGAPAFGTEYHYLRDGILIRVSGELTPEQAAEYEAALRNM